MKWREGTVRGMDCGDQDSVVFPVEIGETVTIIEKAAYENAIRERDEARAILRGVMRAVKDYCET